MRILVELAKAALEIFFPSPTMVRVRLRISLDHLLTLGLTVLAAAMAVGYQVLGRWGRRSSSSPD